MQNIREHFSYEQGLQAAGVTATSCSSEWVEFMKAVHCRAAHMHSNADMTAP